MNGINFRTIINVTRLVCLLAAAAFAEGAAVETVLTGLHGPRGVAVRPGESAEPYEVFVSDTLAGRIIRMRSDQASTSTEVITGFPQGVEATAGKGPFAAFGPLGLLFLDRDRFVVCVGGGNAAVRLYELSDQAGPQSADGMKQQIELSVADGERKPDAGGILALARTHSNDHVSDMLIVSSAGDEKEGAFWTIPVRAGTLGEIKPFAAANPGEEHPAAGRRPAAIAVSEQGFIVVAATTTAENGRGNRLTYYNPMDASTVMHLPVDLRHIVGLAFSPKTGNLYAVDLGAGNAADGGVYRIDDIGEPGKPACAAVKTAEAIHPTALAFGPDGALYVTAFGSADGSNTNGGVLLRILGDL